MKRVRVQSFRVVDCETLPISSSETHHKQHELTFHRETHMDAVFALFGSPRKLTQPAPPPHDDLHKPAKTQTYSKKDRIRAKRALTRMSGGSERSEVCSLSHGRW